MRVDPCTISRGRPTRSCTIKLNPKWNQLRGEKKREDMSKIFPIRTNILKGKFTTMPVRLTQRAGSCSSGISKLRDVYLVGIWTASRWGPAPPNPLVLSSMCGKWRLPTGIRRKQIELGDVDKVEIKCKAICSSYAQVQPRLEPSFGSMSITPNNPITSPHTILTFPFNPFHCVLILLSTVGLDTEHVWSNCWILVVN